MTKIFQLFFAALTAGALLSGSGAWGQYGIDRQIQFASEQKEKSMLRIDRIKTAVDDAIRGTSDRVKKLVDPIFDAQFNCEKRAYKFDTTDRVEDRLRFLRNTITEFGQSLDPIKRSIERKVDIARRAEERVCYKGSDTRLESYLDCLYARERHAGVLAYSLGIHNLQVMYSIYIVDQVEKYSTCSSKEGAIREEDFLAVGKTAAGIGAVLKVQADSMNRVADQYLSVSN
jgi:hypothetical protein